MRLRSATRDLANEVGENHEIMKRVFANLNETELVKVTNANMILVFCLKGVPHDF